MPRFLRERNRLANSLMSREQCLLSELREEAIGMAKGRMGRSNFPNGAFDDIYVVYSVIATGVYLMKKEGERRQITYRPTDNPRTREMIVPEWSERRTQIVKLMTGYDQHTFRDEVLPRLYRQKAS